MPKKAKYNIKANVKGNVVNNKSKVLNIGSNMSAAKSMKGAKSDMFRTPKKALSVTATAEPNKTTTTVRAISFMIML